MKKFLLLFLILLVASLSYCNLNIQSKDLRGNGKVVNQFLDKGVNQNQFASVNRYLWADSIRYFIYFDNDTPKNEITKKLLVSLIHQAGKVTGLEVVQAKSAKQANLNLFFSDDWKQSFRNQIDKFRPYIHKGMADKEYEQHIAQDSRDVVSFQVVHHKTFSISSTFLFINNRLPNETCVIPQLVVRTFLLRQSQKPPSVFCEAEKLPLLERTFLKAYYGEDYQKYIAGLKPYDAIQAKKYLYRAMQRNLLHYSLQ